MPPKKVVVKKGAKGNPIARAAREAEALGGKLGHRAEESAEQAVRRMLEMLLALIDVQKSAFDNTLELVAKAQGASNKMIADTLKAASWMPKEGKDIVKEWTSLLDNGRKDFQHAVDRSFDLITDYVERVEGQFDGKATAAEVVTKKVKKAVNRAAKTRVIVR